MDQSSRLITEIVADQKASIRTALTSGMESGRGPRSVARDLVGRMNRVTGRREGGIVGLTRQQASYVTRARAELSDPARFGDYLGRARRDRRFDGLVRKAMKEGRPVSAADIDRLAGRYSERLLALRGETIARTELLGSLHEAQDEGLRQLVDGGSVRREQIQREWDAAEDAATRPSHAAAEGQRVGLDEPFSVGGYRMMHPGDGQAAPASETINCRCRVRIDIDYLAALDDEGLDLDPDDTPPAPPPWQLAEAPVVPAGSVGEITDWVTENLAEKARFMDNLPAKPLAEFVGAIAQAHRQFDVGRIQAVASASVVGVKTRGMAFYLQGRRAFALNPSALKKVRPYAPDQKTIALKKRADGLKDASAEVKERAEKVNYDWLARDDGGPASLAHHEYGHFFHEKYAVEVNSAMSDSSFGKDRWPRLVSDYGMTNRGEYVAEAFSLYMKGEEEHYRIFPKLLEIFKAKDKLNGG